MTVDVIIPIYKGLAQTRRCVESVLACSQSVAFELVLIDDCSPDVALQDYLATFSGRQGVSLFRNELNLGFVASVNRGMSLHPDRDVVLLNSDTEVANDWLDRLLQCAYRYKDVATVTPFSNNATICSYPYEGWTGELPGLLGLAELDALFAKANSGLDALLPTAVGSCMFIRRACLDAIGYFDSARFGRGYGEENDFSIRAAKAGWRNLLAADVFVFHEGGVSFGEHASELRRQASKLLLQAHPDYLERVCAWRTSESLELFRKSIDLLRVGIGQEEAGQVLSEYERYLQLMRSGDEARVEEMQASLEIYKAEIDALRTGLANAESLVAQLRAEQLAEVSQTDALSLAFAHAERLAIGRQQELDHIKSTLLWRMIKHVSKIRTWLRSWK